MIHIIPNNDTNQHTEDTTCDCMPNVLFENGEMIVVHNSFDGRENIEEGGMEDCTDDPDLLNKVI